MRDGEFKPGELLPGTRYRVVGLIGAGGMGLVYDVEHVELGKRFVLKALLSDLAGREDIVARLRNEQRALGRLQHPNIVAVTDAGVTSSNLPFFVMERLEGETLGARLKRKRRLPITEALAIARGVLEGLSAAHEIGVVHRDIKPQNIFLSSGGRPKVLDFGVAKIADAARVITARGVAIGTPRYMSPEQVAGEGVDGRSDLYAVGLLLFEMIVGRGPFDDVRDANELLVAHLSRPAPRLASVAAGVPNELGALVASLLAKAPSDRPLTARAANAALTVILGRYGGGSSLDAATPHASRSSTTQPLFVPGSPPGEFDARLDGVEGSELGTFVEPTTRNPTTEVLPDTTLDRGSSFGQARAPGGTLYDPSSRSLTVAHENFVVPPDAVRTERLDIAGFAPTVGDDPTHTRVPATPSDGSSSLAPVRVEGPRSQRARPVAFFLACAAVLALVCGAWLLARSGAPDAASAPAEAARPTADDGERAETKVSPRAPDPLVTRAIQPTPVPKSAAPASPPPPRAVLPDPTPSRERPPLSRKAPSNGPPGAIPSSSDRESAPSSRAQKTSSPESPLPPGLPGSGL